MPSQVQSPFQNQARSIFQTLNEIIIIHVLLLFLLLLFDILCSKRNWSFPTGPLWITKLGGITKYYLIILIHYQTKKMTKNNRIFVPICPPKIVEIVIFLLGPYSPNF